MKVSRLFWGLLLSISCVGGAEAQVTFQSLLKEMGDRSVLAKFPQSGYRSLQSSSYNRASVVKDSAGWFADSDGTGFIRKEENNGHEEWVVMEHTGPGAITRMWAPYFYYGGLDDLEGPEINIYLDGDPHPVISENYFKLITGRGSFPVPLVQLTARAGDSYLPIPFAKSCKITFNKKPFYHIISYRAYPQGTNVVSFDKDQLRLSAHVIEDITQSLYSSFTKDKGVAVNRSGLLSAGKEISLDVRKAGAIREFTIDLDPVQAKEHPELLRSLVLIISFDGRQTVWAPVGDFFGSSDALHPFHTFTRSVNASGQMRCTWVMPFQTSFHFTIRNMGNTSIDIKDLSIKYSDWLWDERSMYFHANWRSDELLAGNIFKDWNFIDIRGKGVIVGDQLTVLNPDEGWWGEGDEKIYIDEDWNNKFPSHFGTGTEDYYGWAGGEVPGKDDVFSHPFLANIEVGSATPVRRGAKGFNICTRVRALDAIPFSKRLVFDMEASPGTQIRNAWNFLDYSAMVFWYGRPGTVDNRPPLPEQALKRVITLAQIDSLSNVVKAVLNK